MDALDTLHDSLQLYGTVSCDTRRRTPGRVETRDTTSPPLLLSLGCLPMLPLVVAAKCIACNALGITHSAPYVPGASAPDSLQPKLVAHSQHEVESGQHDQEAKCGLVLG